MMDVQTKEVEGSYRWLMFAGGLALLLSCVLFWVDSSVMQSVPERDSKHAEQMRELRLAQSALPARVTDDRQTLPLLLEEENQNVGGADNSQKHSH